MPLNDWTCSCGYQGEFITYGEIPICPECKSELTKIPFYDKTQSYEYVKIQGGGGYPSRQKQVRNTTYRIHPTLEHQKNTIYFT